MSAVSSTMPSIFSTVTQLGPVISVHPASQNQQRSYRNAGLALIASSVLLALGLAPFLARLRDWELLGVCLLIAAGIGLFAAVVGFIDAYVSPDKAVVVYEQGLAYADKKGLQTIRWEEVQQLWASVYHIIRYGRIANTIYVYALERADGRRIEINGVISDTRTIGQLAQQHVYPLLAPRLIAAYNAGETVKFGKASLSKSSGFQADGKTIAWGDIQEVRHQRGYLHIASKTGGLGSGLKLDAGLIPNFGILLDMLHQIVGLQVDHS